MDFNLHIPANALVGVTLLALVTSNSRYATEQYWLLLRRPMKLGITLTLGVAIAGLSVQSHRGWGESVWLGRAEMTPYFSTERAAALEKAFAFEPENFQTAYDIGECYRTQSLQGGDDYLELGQKALDWYARAIRVNAHDGYSHLRTGMCLDWLGKTQESAPFYAAAEERDPNGYYMVAHIGWHYVQTGDFAAAREWFERSLKLSGNNPTAKNYLSICESKLADQASGRNLWPTGY
jgi:tetratricopeptide (TPR) repeat protein